jgi:hypothetical protein
MKPHLSVRVRVTEREGGFYAAIGIEPCLNNLKVFLLPSLNWAGQHVVPDSNGDLPKDSRRTCMDCPLHSYQDVSGLHTECKRCPQKQLTAATGSQSEDDCFEVVISVVASSHKLWIVVEMEEMPTSKVYVQILNVLF